MGFKIIKLSNCCVQIKGAQKFTAENLCRVLSRYGKVGKIDVDSGGFYVLYFQSAEEVKKCVEDVDYLASVFSDPGSQIDEACVGDTVSNSEQTPGTPGKVKKFFNQLTRGSKSIFSKSQNNISKLSPNVSRQEATTSKPIEILPTCTSPVLLNTEDPNFRLAYCHSTTTLKPDTKMRKPNSFNQSIRTYLEGTSSEDSQEILLTNLPPNTVQEDVYKLCGKIEPESVELKTTSNTNVLYAYVKVKKKDDFEQLREILSNCFINGRKITSIPITKISGSLNESNTNIQGV